MQTQTFLLLRGHQGSGKSTFAAQKTAEFLAQYPDGEVVHIENDLLLTDENGVYRWSPEALDKAQRQGQAAMRNAFKRGQAERARAMLVLNSNTNQKSSACIAMMQMARKHGFAVEVCRLHNFFANDHGVNEADVLAAYLKLNQNRLREEVHIPAVQPMSAEQAALLAQMERFSRDALPFDEARQTFVTAEYLALGRRNFTAKASRRHPGLRVLKYARSVFYDNRFDDALLEMRGMVIDEHNHIIVRPFKKVFNYSERTAKNSKYPLKMDDAQRVDAVVKVNGFLGCCTHVRLPEHHPSRGAAFDNTTLYSTTGSLDSAFADLVQSHCAQYENLFAAYPNHTFLFEITDESDPHIIREQPGETLIGIIDAASGRQFAEAELDRIAAKHGIRRPATLRGLTFGELKAMLQTVEHEGFMVFDAATQQMLFKLKSPYYLVSKLLGRSNETNLAAKLDKRRIDEEFYPLIDHIRERQDEFNALDEQEKIAFVQAFLREL